MQFSCLPAPTPAAGTSASDLMLNYTHDNYLLSSMHDKHPVPRMPGRGGFRLGRQAMIDALRASLARMGVDRVDLYQVHLLPVTPQ